ncbi:MAG: Uma2 family endonuclease [Sulfuricellaceae bacterium]
MGLALKKPTLYTVDDYMSWTDDEFRCELIDGVIYDMSAAPVVTHQEVVAALHVELAVFLRERHKQGGGGGGPPCLVLESPVDVILTRNTVVQPDLIVLCNRAKIINGKNIQGAPDLVVEILSPSTAAKDKREKHRVYERAGVPQYLIVDPHEQYAELYTLGEEGRYAAPAVLAAEDLLELAVAPGMGLTLEAIFGWPLPGKTRPDIS